jgi:hypothetical protein
MRKSEAKLCERCQEFDSIRGSRYCNDCKKAVLKELQENGYLTARPHQAFRSREQQENTQETKHGTGHG